MGTILLAVAFAAPPGPLQIVNLPTNLELKAGPTIGFEIALSHTGTGRIAVTGIDAGCGCVKLAVKEKDLQAGQRTVLTFAVNTLTQPAGANTWTATVKYRHLPDGATDFVEHSLPVRLTANLTREVTATPPSVSLSTTGAANTSVILSDSRAKPFTITGVSASAPYITATHEPGEKGKQKIAIAIADSAPAGHTEDWVVLTTDDPEYRFLRIPVRISKRVAGSVSASPAEVDLKFATGQEEASAVVVLRNPDGQAIQIQAAESDHAGVKLAWSKNSSTTATVRMTIPAGTTGPAEVRVKMTSPAGAAITIPVSWTSPR
jgi:hypothetical protein